MKLLRLPFCWFVFSVLASFVITKADDGSDSYYNQFTACDESVVVIQDLSILCDSPGSYYYGSNKYRNSAECQGGDKAKLEIVFTIEEELEEAYLTVQVEAYGSVQGQTLHYEAELCSVSALSSVYGDECPAVGTYKVSEVFYWPDQDDDQYEYSFVPKVVVGLKSEQDKGNYDLGGANTDLCAGNTFVSWTTGVGKSAANTLRTFLITFGILLGCVLAIGAAAWFIMKKANEKPKEQVVDDDMDENEYHKIAMVGNNRNLVDF